MKRLYAIALSTTFSIACWPSSVLALSFNAVQVKPLRSTPRYISLEPKDSNYPPVIASPSFLGQIIDRILRGPDDTDHPPTTSRPINGQCLLSPAQSGTTVSTWHKTPLFIWQGQIAHFRLTDADTGDVMWEYTPGAEETQIVYAGVPLRSGHFYKWEIYDSERSQSPQSFPEFKVLDLSARLAIDNGLSIAEAQADGTEEGKAIARAQYFADQSLSIDAIQALFSVASPSVDLLQAQETIVNSLCSP